MKKKRSRIKRAFKWLVISSVVVVLGIGLTLGLLWQREPFVSKDWIGELNRLTESLEPRGEPAWPIYRDILITDFGLDSVDDPDRTVLRNEIDRVFHRSRQYELSAGEWSDPVHDPSRSLLAISGSALKKLDAAAALPRLGKPYTRSGDAIQGELSTVDRAVIYYLDVDESKHLHRLARLNQIRLRDAVANERWDEFSRALRTSFAQANHMASAGTLVEMLRGVNVGSRAMAHLRYVLSELDLPVAQSRAIDRELDEFVRPETWGKNLIDIESLCAMSGLDTLFTQSGKPVLNAEMAHRNGIAFDVIAVVQSPKMFQASLFGRRTEMVDSLRGYQEETKELYSVPAREFEASFERFQNELRVNFLNEALQFHAVRPTAHISVRGMRAVLRDLRATSIMLRLEAIHAETGKWPASLEIPELAEFNECALTGKPFVYALTPDDPYGRAYTLHAPETVWKKLGGEDFTEPRPILEPKPDGSVF